MPQYTYVDPWVLLALMAGTLLGVLGGFWWTVERLVSYLQRRTQRRREKPTIHLPR
jgi:hypothetical protein